MNNVRLRPLGDECLLYGNVDSFLLLTAQDYGEPKFGRTYYEEGNEYSNLLTFFGLEKEYEATLAGYLNEARQGSEAFIVASKKLCEALDTAGIHSDAYEEKFVFPLGTDIDYLFALAYFGFDELLNLKIKELSDYLKTDEELDMEQGVHCFAPDIKQWFALVHEELPSMRIAETLSKIAFYERMKELTKKYRLPKSKPIAIDAYKKALSIVYESLGEEAHLQDDLNHTIRYSKKVFKDLNLVTFK